MPCFLSLSLSLSLDGLFKSNSLSSLSPLSNCPTVCRFERLFPKEFALVLKQASDRYK